MGTVTEREGDGVTGGLGATGTGILGGARSLLAISSSSHSMGIGCVLLPVSRSPCLPVSPSLCFLVSPSVPLSFLSVNVEFLRVTLNRSAGALDQRGDIGAAI